MENQGEEKAIIANLRNIYYRFRKKIPLDENSEISAGMRERVNYYIGVSMEYLTENKVKNFSDLVKITLKYKREYKKDLTPFEKELNLETNQYFQLI